MAELLLELFSEEIPARMQSRAADQLRSLLLDLAQTKLGFEKEVRAEHIRSFTTPRRVVAVIEDLPTVQPDVREERRGPRTDAPEKAIEGFLRSIGFDSADQCEQRETKKGTFYFAVIEKAGRPTAEVLAEEIPALIESFSWPKSMRWGDGALRWVRPLHSVLCLFDGAVVPGTVTLGSATGGSGQTLSFTDKTRGHRWLSSGDFQVNSFADYKDKLAAAHVMLDAADRRQVIEEQGLALAESAGVAFDPDDALLTEVAGLVEWPVCLLGGIDDAFMDVPSEALITSMKSHQKYFPLNDQAGNLANQFIVVANIEAPDGGDAIRAGNERVLRARLHDAKFFWDQDRRQPLESRVARLDGIVYHAKLGSLGEKVRRLETLASAIAEFVAGAEADAARRAATLCKADLVTGMVGEFADLQGVMGRYYARHDGESEAVAQAIGDHHAPAGPSDACPREPVSVALALADKIDSLAGFFAIDERPTGSKDPFALRRAALGVIRLIVENQLRLPLRTVLAQALDGYGSDIVSADTSKVVDDIMAFFADRLRVHMRDQGLRHDVVSAVFAVAGDDDLVRLMRRADALKSFLDTDDGANLLTGYRRASNIVGIEEKKDGSKHDGAVDTARLEQAEERGLNDRLAAVEGDIGQALTAEDFEGAMAALATLRTPIDQFFDAVTVNSDDADLRVNRLRLLSRIRASLSAVGDFTKIEG